ncbi:hypothetical protein FQN57_001197 [Myotisia sp. PD_48]|nr:hypothetical protein FQN57_001197 [Myotisia sp. PD_48]
MSSGPGQTSVPSKSVSGQNQAVSGSQTQFYSPGIDSASQRRAIAGAQPSRSQTSARNNQSRKPPNKRHRKPRLADEDAMAESSTMRSTTSRKGQTSITHLMNFSLPPRPHPHNPFHRPHRRSVTSWPHSGSHAVDKARYVHANYRFIVDPTKNYHAQATNADVHLDWDTVLQILVATSIQAASCPICLSTPVAPRMAKCGHIFCLPCLIRFMHSSDDARLFPEKRARWKKCPICWDAIYLSEVKCVRWYSGQLVDSLVEGGDIFLRLVMRKPGSTLALPRDGIDPLQLGDDLPWYNAADVSDYARIMKGGEIYMIAHYDSEIKSLEDLEHEDELMFQEDPKWTQKAIAAIREAKEKVKGIGNPPEVPRQSVDSKKHSGLAPINFEATLGEGAPEMYYFQHAQKSGQSLNHTTPPPESPDRLISVPGTDDISSAVTKLNIEQHPSKQPMEQTSAAPSKTSPTQPLKDTSKPHPPDQPYFFYQALPHFYLSSLDIRILKAAFGDFSVFPSTILPRVEHISTGHIVDNDLRKRAKYLNHLPYGCELTFLECDWTDLVNPTILERFSNEISRRRRRNIEKSAREEKERVRAERAEDEERWAAARRKRSSISASTEQPFNDNDFQPLGASPNADPFEVDNSLSTAFLPWSPSQAREHQSFTALASPSNSPPSRRTVWGTTAIESGSPIPIRQQEPTNDGWLHNWETELLAEQQDGFASGETSSSTPNGTGKRKKNKKITLMSTNARRAA